MTGSELFQAGRLREAIDAQVAKVKAQPTDRSARFFLFELFLFAGDLDRARKQLDVLKYDDPRHSAAAEQYKAALDAETKRRAVFAGTEQPKVLAAAPDHVRQRLEALPYLARGEQAEARSGSTRRCRGPEPDGHSTASRSTDSTTRTSGSARCWKCSAPAALPGCRSNRSRPSR